MTDNAETVRTCSRCGWVLTAVYDTVGRRLYWRCPNYRCVYPEDMR